MAKKRGVKKGSAKKPAPKPPLIESNEEAEAIAQALSSVNQSVFLKVCRLCETKDGPFLNIFDPDTITAKKIEIVMPFVIKENDDLPHKICFRCSAKVEELYEFIQKCTQAQHNLRKALGNKGTVVTKSKHRELWEEKLNKSNISNDDICDALIKKAMEGIKDIPLNPIIPDDPTPNKTVKKTEKIELEKEAQVKVSPEILRNILPKEEETKEVTVKSIKQVTPKVGEVPVLRSMRSSLETKTDVSKKTAIPVENNLKKNPPPLETKSKTNSEYIETKAVKKCYKAPTLSTSFSLEEPETPIAENPAEKPFDIMDHVSMIKVNGVGVLFQCKLCNRNFLKKDIVMLHACARNGPAKVQPKQIVAPEPPKLSSVKYINTKKTADVTIVNENPIMLDDDNDEDDKLLDAKKSKPKVGPASKVKHDTVVETPHKANHMTIQVTPKPNPNVESPVVRFPSAPSLNSRYKLMPGPNNTFTLVEEKVPESTPATSEQANPEPVVEPKRARPLVGPKRFKNNEQPVAKVPAPVQAKESTLSSAPVPVGQPYPVGLFKSVQVANNNITLPIPVPTFPTPAMKKQSYTIVQTGNPSKLLISTKPQAVEQPPTKRQKKTKPEVKKDDKPYNVSIQNAVPPKNAEFFTFINVDPLLQPSYVLPTDNIIQESQISTSTKQNENNKDSRYTCNMCNEIFSREKKLLTHIQSHYNKMDQEDQIRAKESKRKKF